ncbi:MAG: hypothetical protein A2V83_10510 [Nitrospirae bacterium RBG_16_64_22]|nr:MAG: hypothetical protein A2V83_10510 [Nitrospirae bacterium RBG_16_64_22]
MAQEKAVIEVPDLIVRTGEAPELRLQVRSAGFFGQGIGGEVVSVRAGKWEGSALTGEGGWGRLALPRLPEGVHELRASLASTRRYSARPATGVAAFWPLRRPWAVVVLEGAAAPAKREALPIGSVGVGPPRDGAPDGFRRLSSTHAVVVLTRRSERSRAEIRAWLDEHKFPAVPVVFLSGEPGSGEGASADLKAWLAERRKEGRRLSVGIAERREDLHAFLDAGLRAVRIGEGGKIPEKARRVPTWKDVRKEVPQRSRLDTVRSERPESVRVLPAIFGDRRIGTM